MKSVDNRGAAPEAADADKVARERWRAIMSMAEAHGREKFATYLAGTDLSIELVQDLLALSPHPGAPKCH